MNKQAKAINSHCPWSGDPVSADSLTTYLGQTVGFCNPGCRDKFDAACLMSDQAFARTQDQPEPR